jgi:predicted dehydrogenase
LVLLLRPHPGESWADETQPPAIRVGIIGLDTSHSIAFTKTLNDPQAASDIANCRVVAAYPPGSPDIESSVRRVAGYTAEIRGLGVEIVSSIEELLGRVDAVLLETNDGRPHLEQVRLVLKARKPVFVDKPVSGSLSDAIAIFREAEQAGVPIFSTSSLRYMTAAQAARHGSVGDIIGCDTFSPCTLEATHPDLYWYGIHGVETLFTVMGTGCQSVVRISTEGTDMAVGTWSGGRIGSFRGLRAGKTGYGGTVFGSNATLTLGSSEGYRPLIVEIVKMFRTGKPPVEPRETLEIYAFMEAADESKRRGGVPVSLAEVMRIAEQKLKP